MFGKARSKAELQQMKNEYLANLQVEIENSNVLEKKIRKPDEAPPVPPQYKTEAELRADIQAIDNELIQTMMNDIGYGYTAVMEVIGGISTDDKIKLLALYPQFKATLAKDGVKSRLRLLDPAFVNQKIKQFLQMTNKSQGTANLAGIPATIEELQEMMPSEDNIILTLKTISNPTIVNLIGAKKFATIDKYLRKYLGIYPSLDQINSFKTSKLNNTTRTILAGDLGRLMLDYKMITIQDLDGIRSGIVDLINSGEEEQIGEFIEGKLGGADDRALKQFASNWKTTLATAGGENLPPTDVLDEITTDFGALSGKEIEDNARYLKRFKNQEDNLTIKRDSQGNIYQKVRTSMDDESSTLASRMSEDVRSLAEFADDEESQSLADDINSVLNERPTFASRLQVIEMRKLNEAGYRSVDEIRDQNEARALLSVLHSAFDEDLKENVGMTIEEIEETEYGNVLNQQSVLASDYDKEMQSNPEFRDYVMGVKFDKYFNTPTTIKGLENLSAEMMEEMSRGEVPRIRRQSVYEYDDTPLAPRRESVSLEPQLSAQERGQLISNVFDEIESPISQNAIEGVLRNVDGRVRDLVSAVKVKDIQPIVDLIYQYANLNYGVQLGLPPVFNSAITTKRQIHAMIMDRVIKPVIESNLMYNPDDMRLFNPADYEETRDKRGLSGFGMKKMKKGFRKMPDSKIMKDEKMGQGMCGSGVKGRISVKKLVGRGIAVENQPTYKQFGKYVMHYPHLVNNNVFNVKYPSLGSIPAIKPKTITDDYKDFVLDIFDTGKMNERLFNTLDNDEKTHFHKVCKGAGLLELFKLKKGDTGEEKEDLDRFNLLKGSFIAGNNGESVIRELRGLITKFIHEGRITKNEGLSLLMEIK
jgi:hypothetical protein